MYTSHVHCDWRDDRLDSAFFPLARSSALWTEQPHLQAEIVRTGDVLTAPASGWDEGEPLREWVAFDGSGDVLRTGLGEAFAWPPGAAEVEVTVGRALVVRYTE